MTPRIAAIFADDPVVTPAPAVADVVAKDVTVEAEPIVTSSAEPWEPWPIVAGTEHYQVFVPDEDCPWPEFIPGHHYDFRQSSRLRPLLAPVDHCHLDEPKTNT